MKNCTPSLSGAQGSGASVPAPTDVFARTPLHHLEERIATAPIGHAITAWLQARTWGQLVPKGFAGAGRRVYEAIKATQYEIAQDLGRVYRDVRRGLASLLRSGLIYREGNVWSLVPIQSTMLVAELRYLPRRYGLRQRSTERQANLKTTPTQTPPTQTPPPAPVTMTEQAPEQQMLPQVLPVVVTEGSRHRGQPSPSEEEAKQTGGKLPSKTGGASPPKSGGKLPPKVEGKSPPKSGGKLPPPIYYREPESLGEPESKPAVVGSQGIVHVVRTNAQDRNTQGGNAQGRNAQDKTAKPQATQQTVARLEDFRRRWVQQQAAKTPERHPWEASEKLQGLVLKASPQLVGEVLRSVRTSNDCHDAVACHIIEKGLAEINRRAATRASKPPSPEPTSKAKTAEALPDQSLEAVWPHHVALGAKTYQDVVRIYSQVTALQRQGSLPEERDVIAKLAAGVLTPEPAGSWRGCKRVPQPDHNEQAEQALKKQAPREQALKEQTIEEQAPEKRSGGKRASREWAGEEPAVEEQTEETKESHPEGSLKGSHGGPRQGGPRRPSQRGPSPRRFPAGKSLNDRSSDDGSLNDGSLESEWDDIRRAVAGLDLPPPGKWSPS